MKRSLLYVLTLWSLGCSDIQYPPVHELTGDWLRVNNSPTQTTVEHWEKDQDKFFGYGKTYELDSLIFYEKMEILKDKNNRYLFVVEGVNEEETVFEITSWDQHHFRAENPENEFPKWIQYRFNKDSMIAVIGDGKDQINFDFVRTTDLEL